VYKAILKPIQTYGVQMWGTALNSSVDILERFQSKVLRIITGAPWYVTNTVVRRDLRFLPVRQEVKATASPIATGSTTTPTGWLKHCSLDLPSTDGSSGTILKTCILDSS
jgi:hypothetical protein